MNHRFSAYAVALTISVPSAHCATNYDWPQWQGPDRNSVSKETGLLQEWPKTITAALCFNLQMPTHPHT
jgi:hypothetical protein